MKKKSHTPPPPIPPPSSSSSSSSDASDSESDDRELQPQATHTAPAASTGHAKPKPSPPPFESKSEECEYESETSGSEDIMTATPAPSATNKRKSPSKEPSSAATSGAGRKMFQRLWTDEDELALIKGLVKYNKKHGKDPSTASEYSAFLDQIKGRLHIEFSKDQFLTKLRTIKRKYTKYLGKVMNGGGSITSVKEHDQNCFDLLMKVWGDELKTRSPKKDIKNEDVGVEKEEAMDYGESGPKKKMKTEAAGTQVIENGNGEDGEDVDGECNFRFVCNVFEDIFNRNNMEASIKDQLKKALLGMEPRELKDWVKRFTSQYNLKWDALRGLNDLDNEFIQTLWTNLKP